MSEIRIARFVDIEACKSIFSENSTFVLRSPEYYRRLYETDGAGKGDGAEGIAETPDGRRSEFNRWVASCWTILKKDKPTSDEWDIFKEKDQNIVAIVSTPSKVCEFLDKVLETSTENTNWRFPFHLVKHDKVNYEEVPPVDDTNITDIVPFDKDAQFTKQKEYRFVLTHGWSNLIESFIFCGGIDYMEKRFVNPEMCKEKKGKLQNIIREAGYGCYGDFKDMKMGDIIANIDDLF